MKRARWGGLEDGSDKKHETKPDEIILPNKKAQKLKQLKETLKNLENGEKVVQIKLKNPLVTQTVEVMNQTEMLQALIDTYANKSGFNNYVLNSSQMIPQVNFPPENAADLITEDKFAKPLWFIPPVETRFSKGIPKNYKEVNKEIARAAVRKTTCGLLRIAGFTDAAHSALTLYTDAVEEFFRNFLAQVKDVQITENKEKENQLDILTLEKGYFAMTQNSLICLHNYFKNDIIARNRAEIDEFKEAYSEYDKLKKESQKMQRDPWDYTGASSSTTQQAEMGSGNIMNLLETDYSNTCTFKETFEGELMETSTSDDQINLLKDLQQWSNTNNSSMQ